MALRVKQRTDGQWEVSEDSIEEPLLSFETQEDALSFALSIAQTHFQPEVILYVPQFEYAGDCVN